jgi:hypothetical protein
MPSGLCPLSSLIMPIGWVRALRVERNVSRTLNFSFRLGVVICTGVQAPPNPRRPSVLTMPITVPISPRGERGLRDDRGAGLVVDCRESPEPAMLAHPPKVRRRAMLRARLRVAVHADPSGPVPGP